MQSQSADVSGREKTTYSSLQRVGCKAEEEGLPQGQHAPANLSCMGSVLESPKLAKNSGRNIGILALALRNFSDAKMKQKYDAPGSPLGVEPSPPHLHRDSSSDGAGLGACMCRDDATQYALAVKDELGYGLG